MPETSEVTEPEPEPDFATESVYVGVNPALTLRAALMVTTHDPVPEQPAPDQPVKRDPAAGVAVRVTTVASSKLAAQVTPQLTPAGLEVTVPDPAPVFDTLSTQTGTKVAVTARAALIVTTQLPVPEQPEPDQPEKRDPAAGAAVSVTTVPEA